jgi:hypothetical protein
MKTSRADGLRLLFDDGIGLGGLSMESGTTSTACRCYIRQRLTRLVSLPAVAVRSRVADVTRDYRHACGVRSSRVLICGTAIYVTDALIDQPPALLTIWPVAIP